MSNIASVVLKHEDAARGSLARSAVEVANVSILMELNQGYTAAGAATATTTSKAKTANTFAYTIGGKRFSLSATDNYFVLGAAGATTTVAANSFQKYLLCTNAAGTDVVYEGVQASTAAGVTWSNINNTSPYAPILTVLNAGNVIVSVLTIATDATHTFIPGTTLFGATGITATFIDGIDLALLPVLATATGLVIGQSV